MFLHRSSAYAVVVAQALLVVLSTFTTGSLIRPDKVSLPTEGSELENLLCTPLACTVVLTLWTWQVPDGWAWLQEVSYYFWASNAAAVAIFDEVGKQRGREGGQPFASPRLCGCIFVLLMARA